MELDALFYELREHHLALPSYRDYIDDFLSVEVPIMRECGFTFHGIWMTEIGVGATSTLLWMVSWNTLDDRSQGFARLREHPDLRSFLDKNAGRVERVDIRILTSLTP